MFPANDASSLDKSEVTAFQKNIYFATQKLLQLTLKKTAFKQSVLQVKADVPIKLRIFIQATYLKVTVLMCFHNMKLAGDRL